MFICTQLLNELSYEVLVDQVLKQIYQVLKPEEPGLSTSIGIEAVYIITFIFVTVMIWLDFPKCPDMPKTCQASLNVSRLASTCQNLQNFPVVLKLTQFLENRLSDHDSYTLEEFQSASSSPWVHSSNDRNILSNHIFLPHRNEIMLEETKDTIIANK